MPDKAVNIRQIKKRQKQRLCSRYKKDHPIIQEPMIILVAQKEDWRL